MSGTGPRYARRTDSNHSEIRQLFKDCGCKVQDTSNLGGKVGDLIVQYRDPMYLVQVLECWVVEIKPGSKKKLTKSQEDNVLELVRIDSRADVFELLNQTDWELI
jgi:hypothetical protein